MLLLTFSGVAQILQPAKWSPAISSNSVKAGEEVEIIFNVTIDKDWYLYSSEFDCEDGPIKTSVTLEPNAGYELVGTLVAINPVDKYDDIFECDVKVFKKT
ncbi:MAG: protein-disulfide reductase DsbD family protein, partial [Cyclobacteriaceae bacterium]